MPPGDKETLTDKLRRLAEAATPEAEARAENARQDHENAMVDAAIAWLREKWGTDQESAPCPYCGHDAYTVAPPVETHPFGRRNVIKAFIPVTCMNCAQTIFLDAERSTGFPIPNDMKSDSDDSSKAD